jgi:cellulose synthase/poly-beta-1,6-N-acetylglucosamine synthase-like glycosyltransferase
MSTVSEAGAAFKAAALQSAIDGLRTADPLSSAAVPLVRWQRAVLLSALAIIAAAAVLAPSATFAALTGICTAVYLAAIADRLLIFGRGLARDAIVAVSDEEALALTDAELPPYTVLVPAYNEPEVVGDLIAAMRSLRYPAAKLQVLLLLEEDDEATIEAAR